MSDNEMHDVDQHRSYSSPELAFLQNLAPLRNHIRNLRQAIIRAELRDVDEYKSVLILHRQPDVEEAFSIGDQNSREALRYLADYINEVLDQSQWDDHSDGVPKFVGEELDCEFESLGNVCRSAFFRSRSNEYKRQQFPG